MKSLKSGNEKNSKVHSANMLMALLTTMIVALTFFLICAVWLVYRSILTNQLGIVLFSLVGIILCGFVAYIFMLISIFIMNIISVNFTENNIHKKVALLKRVLLFIPMLILIATSYSTLLIVSMAVFFILGICTILLALLVIAKACDYYHSTDSKEEHKNEKK